MLRAEPYIKHVWLAFAHETETQHRRRIRGANHVPIMVIWDEVVTLQYGANYGLFFNYGLFTSSRGAPSPSSRSAPVPWADSSKIETMRPVCLTPPMEIAYTCKYDQRGGHSRLANARLMRRMCKEC